MSRRDHYDILGVSRTATAEVIRAAHRVQSRRYHPDTADDGKGDARLFAQIQEAYETLSNADNRRRYDTKMGFDREATGKTVRRPPKTTCAGCSREVYASQLQLYLGRHLCARCYSRKRQRDLNRPQLTGSREWVWQLKRFSVWAQSHLAILAMTVIAAGAIGIRLATVESRSWHGRRATETPVASDAGPAAAPQPALSPTPDPCRVIASPAERPAVPSDLRLSQTDAKP